MATEAEKKVAREARQVKRDAEKAALAVEPGKRTKAQSDIVAAIIPRKSPEEVMSIRMGRAINALRKYAARLDEDKDSDLLATVEGTTTAVRELRVTMLALILSGQETESDDADEDDEEEEESK